MNLFELPELVFNKLFHLTQKLWQLVSPQTNFHNNFAQLFSISLWQEVQELGINLR